MKALLLVCLLGLSFGAQAQDVLPPAPVSEQQPIGMPRYELSKGAVWGIAASCIIGGIVLLTPKPSSNVYVGAGIIAVGTTTSLLLGRKRRTDMPKAIAHQ
jgi:hypothetical protein